MSVNNFFSPTANDPIVSTLFLMHFPEVYNKLVKRFPRQRSLDFLRTLGRYEPVKQTSYNIHEEDQIMDYITIAAVSNTGSFQVTITLSNPSDYAESGTRSYPRVSDRVEFINGAQGLIVSKNVASAFAHTITIQPINQAVYNVQTAAQVGDVLGIFSGAHEEGGTGYSEVLLPTTTVFTNQTQIFREYMSVTSSEQGNETWVDFTYPQTHPKAGESGRFYFIKAEADMVDRFMLKRELGLFTDDINDANLLAPSGSGNVVRTTRGFIPHLKQYAQQMDYVNQPTMAVFDTMVRLLNKVYGDKENMLMMGLNFGLGLKNFGLDMFKNGSVIYGNDGIAQDALKLGFKTLENSMGYTFHCQQVQALNHAATTGLSGMSYPDVAILVPMTKVKDTETGQDMDAFAVKYKKAAGMGARDWYKVWEIGGNSDRGTDNRLVRELHYQSEEGAQVYGGQRFIYITKKAA